jgi:hypothetical protein
VYLDESTNQRNNFICIGVVAISLVLTILLRISLVLENDRRDHLSPEEYDREAAIKEPCDWVSSYLTFLILIERLFSCSIPKYDTFCDIPTSSFILQNEPTF